MGTSSILVVHFSLFFRTQIYFHLSMFIGQPFFCFWFVLQSIKWRKPLLITPRSWMIFNMCLFNFELNDYSIVIACLFTFIWFHEIWGKQADLALTIFSVFVSFGSFFSFLLWNVVLFRVIISRDFFWHQLQIFVSKTDETVVLNSFDWIIEMTEFSIFFFFTYFYVENKRIQFNDGWTQNYKRQFL